MSNQSTPSTEAILDAARNVDFDTVAAAIAEYTHGQDKLIERPQDGTVRTYEIVDAITGVTLVSSQSLGNLYLASLRDVIVREEG